MASAEQKLLLDNCNQRKSCDRGEEVQLHVQGLKMLLGLGASNCGGLNYGKNWARFEKNLPIFYNLQLLVLL